MTTLDYRIIGRNPDPKIVGVRNGAGQTVFDADFLNRHPHFKKVFYASNPLNRDFWKDWFKWERYGENLIEIKMEKLAKHTDYIDASGLYRGIIVNNRLRAIMESSKLPNHCFFEVTFNQDKKIIDNYWWFCFDYETGENTIDFSKCEFTFPHHQRNIDKNFTADINTYSDYIEVFYKTGYAANATKLVFNSNFDTDLDIWGTQFLTPELFISVKLQKKLEDKNIKGHRVGYPMIDLEFIN